MTASILPFPKANPKADRAFWKGRTEEAERLRIERDMDKLRDTAPCEMNPEEPEC